MKDRQDVVVRTTAGPGSIIIRGDGPNAVYTTDVVKGQLIIRSRKHLLARFAKGEWEFCIARDCQGQP